MIFRSWRMIVLLERKTKDMCLPFIRLHFVRNIQQLSLRSFKINQPFVGHARQIVMVERSS